MICTYARAALRTVFGSNHEMAVQSTPPEFDHLIRSLDENTTLLDHAAKMGQAADNLSMAIRGGHDPFAHAVHRVSQKV